MSNATVNACYNSNYSMTLVTTHEPEYRSLSMIVAKTTGKFELIKEFDYQCFNVLNIESVNSGWVIYVADDVGKPTALSLEIGYDVDDGSPVFNMRQVNYERKWD